MGTTPGIGRRIVPDQPSASSAFLMAPLTLTILRKAGRLLIHILSVLCFLHVTCTYPYHKLRFMWNHHEFLPCNHKVCVEDIECLLDPPTVPSHPEYAFITQGAPGQPK